MTQHEHLFQTCKNWGKKSSVWIEIDKELSSVNKSADMNICYIQRQEWNSKVWHKKCYWFSTNMFSNSVKKTTFFGGGELEYNVRHYSLALTSSTIN